MLNLSKNKQLVPVIQTLWSLLYDMKVQKCEMKVPCTMFDPCEQFMFWQTMETAFGIILYMCMYTCVCVCVYVWVFVCGCT